MPSKNKLSRRNFIKTAGAAGAGVVLSTKGYQAFANNELKVKSSNEKKVPTRLFGKTGVNVSSLALGGMFDIPSSQLLLKQALKWGVTYWDTAARYGGGRSEKGIGIYFKKNPQDRKKIFLVTKSDARDPEGMTKLLNRSLKRMNTSYIDLYLVHSLKRIDEINDQTKRWAHQAKAEKKIRFFGFSTHKNMVELLSEAAKLDWIDGIMTTYNFRLMQNPKMKAAVNACVNAGIGLTAMKTQGGGSIYSGSKAELKLAEHFLKTGFTDKQAKLKAVWDNRYISSICSQMPNITILMSNVSAAFDKTKLAKTELDLFRHYAEKTKSFYCEGCHKLCESTIAANIPISDIMRYLMYYNSYNDKTRAIRKFNKIPSEIRDQIKKTEYEKAEKKCPNQIAISKFMHMAKDILA